MLTTFIRFGLYPMTIVLTMSGMIIGLAAEIHPELVLGTAILFAVLSITLAERIAPFDSNWNKSHQDEKTDALHLVVSMGIIPNLLEGGLQILLFSTAALISSGLGITLWPTELHLGWQLILALVVAEFGYYWLHRGMHEMDLLWRLHSTHHSPKRLYWLNAARFHPLDSALGYCVSVIPLLLLGAGKEVLALHAGFTAVHGMFQHCNVNLKLGPLNWVFSMAELHRWHHSKVLGEANSNYGSNLIVWDIVFGTRFLPTEREAPEQIGLADMEHFPEDYMGQVASPFRWNSLMKKNNP